MCLYSLLIALGITAAAAEAPDYAWFDRGTHVHTMAWSAKQKALYRHADPDLLAIFRVANPDDDPVINGNDFFRNALAVQVDDVLVVNHYLLQYHWDWDPKLKRGRDRYNKDQSAAYVKRSFDHGRTWMPGVRLKEIVGLGDEDAFFMGAVGTSEKSIYIVSRVDGAGGVYRSADAGATWRRIETNLKRDNPSVGRLGGIGPVLIDHPRAGLMIFGTAKIQDPENSDQLTMDSALPIANSMDRGKTWRKVTLDIEDDAVMPVEPTALLLPNGHIFIYARNGPNRSDDAPAQLLIDVRGPGDYELVYAKQANHKYTQNPDTQGVIYNPVTRRIESLFSNRGGSKPFADDEGISVSLWSIPLEDALAGSSIWRYHGLLNTMRGNYGDGDPDRPRDWRRYQDGSHPGLGVVDVQRGKHLAFMHMAASAASFSGTYMIERSLNTDAVGDYLIENAAVEFGIGLGRHEAKDFFPDDNDRQHFFIGADGRYDIAVGHRDAAFDLQINGHTIKAPTTRDPTRRLYRNIPIRRGEEIRLSIKQGDMDFVEIGRATP